MYTSPVILNTPNLLCDQLLMPANYLKTTAGFANLRPADQALFRAVDTHNLNLIEETYKIYGDSIIDAPAENKQTINHRKIIKIPVAIASLNLPLALTA